MAPEPGDVGGYVMGRLETVAPKERLRGHAVRARQGETTLDASVTDGAGRFLLQWPSPVSAAITVELLAAGGATSESLSLTPSDLVSPSSVIFSGRHVIEEKPAETKDSSEIVFEADGDSPLCVTSSCIEVNLSWMTPPGTKASILSGEHLVRDELEATGSLKVSKRGSARYVLRVRPQAAAAGRIRERSVEVRRYPSLSLVVDGTDHKIGGQVSLGVSLCCLAGRDGLNVTVLSSDRELVPAVELRIPPGSSWGSTYVTLGGKTGTADITATAPGYVQDGISLAIC